MVIGRDTRIAMLNDLGINIGDIIHIEDDLLSDNGNERNKYGIDVPANMRRLISGREFLVVERDSFFEDNETMIACKDSSEEFMLARDDHHNEWYITGKMIDSVYSTEDVYEVESIDILFGV